MAEFKEIQIGADGQVYQVKDETARNNAGSGGYEPPEGGIPKDDLADDVQESLGKADTALQAADKAQLLSAINAVQTALNNLMNGQSVTDTIDTFNEVVTFLNGIDTDDPTLFNQLKSLSDAITALQNTLSSKANSSDLQNYATKSELSGKLSQSDISVETQGDGTVDINVGSGANKDTYTINLNHIHPNMAKLVVCEESDLPSTLDPATIYAITDSGETEIEKLIIRGMEFAGGVPDTGMPMVAKPNTLRPLNLGNNTGSGVTALVDVKARNLNYNGSTDGLTVSVGQNSGLLLSYGQTSDATSITIPQLDAETGCQITVKYTGSGALDDGALVFSHDNAVLASVVVVVVVAPVQVAGVKLTGTQWLETDYRVNANTKVVMRCKFSRNSYTQTTSNKYYYLSCRKRESGDTRDFAFYAGIEQANQSGPYNFCVKYNPSSPSINTIARTSFETDDSTLEAYGSTVKFTPHGGSALTYNPNASIAAMTNPLCIGYYIMNGDPRIFNTFDLTIYELTISEGNETKRHYVPATLQGVPGLHDTVTGAFISSETSDELVVIQNS